MVIGRFPEMKDEEKTKDQLIDELVELRKCTPKLGALDAELHRAEERLKEFERKYDSLIENSPDIMYILDPKGYIQFVGGPVESLLGFTSKELKGKHFSSLIWGENTSKASWHFNERRTGNRATKRFETRLSTKDGDKRPSDFNYLPVELHAIGLYDKPLSAKDRNFLGTYGLARDITKRKRAEQDLKISDRELLNTREMLAQAEKLAAIGLLTAGIAHEILNPVNIISMRLQLLSGTEDLSDQAGEALHICKNQLNRIIVFIRTLGQFSGVHKPCITKSEMKKVIGSVLNLCEPQFVEQDIKTELRYHHDLPLIPVDKDKIEQVIFNIITNALSAMAGRDNKVLRISTNLTALKDYVQLLISDTGPGIVQSEKTKIFDPFFTTKDPAEGTGLGLFISYNIIKDHGGRIWADNNEWGGASFCIELPVVSAHP